MLPYRCPHPQFNDVSSTSPWVAEYDGTFEIHEVLEHLETLAALNMRFTPYLMNQACGEEFTPTVFLEMSRTLPPDYLDRLICPIRALKYYLECTKNRRHCNALIAAQHCAKSNQKGETFVLS